jgi:SAM-dependent methyltransferase
VIRELPRVDAEPPVDPDADDNAGHPLRLVTREVAFGGPGTWDADTAARVGRWFDDLAHEWHTRDPHEAHPVIDALARGVPDDIGPRCLEVGSGTGHGTKHLGSRFGEIVALDLAGEMLRLADPALAARVQADAARLPIAASSVDAVVLVNALLFPHEVTRVLRPGGVVVWVNTSGERTPIHLPHADVVAALAAADEGREWSGVASRHGAGTWLVLVRPSA